MFFFNSYKLYRVLFVFDGAKVLSILTQITGDRRESYTLQFYLIKFKIINYSHFNRTFNQEYKGIKLWPIN